MIPRRAWVLAALIAVSCHTSVAARGRDVAGPESVAMADAAPRPSSPSRPRVSGTEDRTHRPRKKPEAEPDEILLCCDLPSGICYPDGGDLCQARTSRLITCAADAVRVFDAAHGFVVCTD